MPPLIGSCLCGAVTITVKDTAGPFGDGLEICNCTDCRQFTGCSRGAEFLECDLENVEIKGDAKCYEKMADTGNSYKRYFCGTCGSSLYNIPGIYGGKKLYPHSGIFKSGTLPEPSVYIFRSSAEKWDKPINGAKTLDKQ